VLSDGGAESCRSFLGKEFQSTRAWWVKEKKLKYFSLKNDNDNEIEKRKYRNENETQKQLTLKLWGAVV